VRGPTPRQGTLGRPRANQGAYAGDLWVVAVLVEVKAPTWREALRRAQAIGIELVEGRSREVPASDLWVRSFTINYETTGGIHDRAAKRRAGAAG
jgi:hypothetical protein